MRYLLLLGFFFCFNKQLFSQSNFGIQWQMGNNQLLNTKPIVNLSAKNTFYYAVAFLYKFQIGKLSLQTGIGYMPVNYDFDFYDTNHFKANLHYLNIPFQINYHIPFSKKQTLLIGFANDFNFRVATKEQSIFDVNSSFYNENIRSNSKFLQFVPKFSLAYQIKILDEELLEIGIFSAYELMNFKLLHYPHFYQERAAYSLIGRTHSFRLGIETKIFF